MNVYLKALISPFTIIGFILTLFFTTTQANTLKICHGFSCKHQKTVALDKNDMIRISQIFKQKADNAVIERQQISAAIALLEKTIGNYTLTYIDSGYNLPKDEDYNSPRLEYHLDCIDESMNTTTYLHFLKQHGYIVHHNILDRIKRNSFLYQHWAALIEDNQTGETFVVDSWFKDNGEPPIITDITQWKTLPLHQSDS